MKLTRVGNAVDRLGIALGKKRKLRMLLDPDMPSLTQRPTAEGLECRLLFAIAVPTALTTFDGITDGAPQVGVTVSGDTIYGTTPIGGQNDDGAVYSMPITGGTPDLISGFNGTNGHQPMGDLLLVNNTLYGTTSAGGANNKGVVFSVPISGGDPTVLATFDGANGADPEAGLIVSNNVLFGTTFSGGANNMGEVFSVPITGGTISVLASFNGTDGQNPQGALVLQNNILYGDTRLGGANGGGVIYSVPIAGAEPTVLANMNTASGETPRGPLVLLNNTLFGAASAAGAQSNGTVFSLPISGGTPAVLFDFDGAHGSTPTAGLILDNGVLYATTAEGGANNLGALIGMFPAANTPILLASFTSNTGSIPLGAVSISNGILYGTTEQGGANNVGTVFSFNTNGADTLVFDQQPQGGRINADIGQVTVFTEKTSDGSFDPLSAAVVQLSIASGPAGAVLSGNTIVTVDRATAIFNGLSVNLAGTYTLIARDIGDVPGNSASFDAERDDTLVFTVAPTTAVADAPIGNVVVQVNTPAGAADTTYNGPVTVSLDDIAVQQGVATLSGTTTVNAVNGVATFSDLSINAEGDFGLQAVDDAFTDGQGFSGFITVTHDPNKLAVAVDVGRSTIAGAFLPGEIAIATLTFDNTSDVLAKGVMNVQLFLDGFGEAGNGTPLNVPALNRLPLVLAAGKSRKVNVAFVVPSLLDQQGEQLRAVLTPISGFAQPTLPTAAVVQKSANEAFVQIGNVGGHPNTHITESIGGVPVHLFMTGPGKATVADDQNDSSILTLNITGTTAASAITAIATSAFALDGITADSVLGSINAPLLNINGNISLPGGARLLRLGNVTGSAFTFGGFSPAIMLMGNLVNTSLVTTAPLSLLLINSFVNTGAPASIQAANITSFFDKGDYAGNLATTGNITVATIRGALTGDILAGANLGADHLPGGNDDTFNPATITSLHVFGSVASSIIIAAGLDVEGDDFAAGTFGGLGDSKIRVIRIDGALSADSKILSLQLPAIAVVAGQRITTANDPRFVTLQPIGF